MGQSLPKLPGMDGGGLDKLWDLEKMKKALTDKSKNASDVDKMATTLEILYAACTVRVLSLADKLCCNEVPQGISLLDTYNQVEIPVAESWDFRLGDWVRIKYPMFDFKSIQLRTLGWNPRLQTVHSYDAVVTKRLSEFEHAITVCTPTMVSSCQLYAGVLEKIPEGERQKDCSPPRWQVNEYVMIPSSIDEKSREILQRGLDTIPERYIGRKGRVIATIRLAVVVTFNERTSYDIHSALLVKCSDQSPLVIQGRVTKNGHNVGQRVRVDANVSLLIKAQAGFGGWSADMTAMAGKEVTIIHIRKNGTPLIQYKYGKHWMINPASLHAIHDSASDFDATSGPAFTRGDIVKIKIIDDIREAMRKKKVPVVYLEFLRLTAELRLVDDDEDYLIRYNYDQQVNVLAPTLRMATVEEKEHHRMIKALVKDIKLGSSVYLDVGPPNFVKSVLRGHTLPQDIVKALTSPSVVIGFTGDAKVVIEYKDGKRYKVKKKYLTVPDKFNMQGNVDGSNLETVKEIEGAIADSVKRLHEDGEFEPQVKIIAMSFGETPFVDMRVYSADTSIGNISGNLLDFNWEVKPGLDNSFYVSGMKLFDREIKLSIFFNEEPYLPKSEIEIHQIPKGVVEEPRQTIRQSSVPDAAAEPPREQQQPRGAQVEHPDIEELQVRDPQGITLKGVRYLRLHGNVYIPICIGVEAEQDFNVDANSANAGSNPSTVLNLSRCKVAQINCNK